MSRRAWRSAIVCAAAVVLGVVVGALVGSWLHQDEAITFRHCAVSTARYVELYGDQPTVAVVNGYDGSSEYYRLPHAADMVCG